MFGGLRIQAGIIAAASAASVALGCSSEAPALAQLLVVVDVDLPVVDQLAGRPELSGDAAVDTLRVELLPPGGVGTPTQQRAFLAPSPQDWPVSFGVAAGDAPGPGPVLLRLRVFRGQLGTPGELAGMATLDPPANVVVDRIVQVSQPSDGIRRVHVTLRGDCLAIANSFSPLLTCLDAAHPSASPDGAIDELAAGTSPATVAGTWPPAAEVPCSGVAPAGALCVPGGFSVLGDLAFVGVGDGEGELDPTPLRPVRVSPFFMDTTEVSVGRLRALLKSGKLAASEVPVLAGTPIPSGSYCTWLGADRAGNDALPVNCVTYAVAEAICAADHGTLPSEAQWEHAARGRGRHLLYPWGDHTPSGVADCCITSASRAGPAGIPTECPLPGGLEAVGSHPSSLSCGGLGDESRDHILDLGGSVGEALRDQLVPFDAGYWSKPGILVDPVCDSTSLYRSSRGGNWNSGLATTAAPFRHGFTPEGAIQGLRCVYPGGNP